MGKCVYCSTLEKYFTFFFKLIVSLYQGVQNKHGCAWSLEGYSRSACFRLLGGQFNADGWIKATSSLISLIIICSHPFSLPIFFPYCAHLSYQYPILPFYLCSFWIILEAYVAKFSCFRAKRYGGMQLALSFLFYSLNQDITWFNKLIFSNIFIFNFTVLMRVFVIMTFIM